MTEHMYDVGFEFLENGTARLEQTAGSLEGATYIDLHPVQVRLLAERMGLLEPSLQVPEPLVTEAHKRRLTALCDRIAEFYHCEHYFNEIFERCASSAEMWLHIRAIYEMADDLIADIGGTGTDATPTPSAHASPAAELSPVQPELAL